MKTLVIALLSLVGSLSFARPYGEAGCGLGTLVMGKDGNQVLAATTNGTSGSQTFGISSGTSNCTEDGAVKSASQVPMFIEVNKVALAKDAARGEGEAVNTLAQMMGCKPSNFGQALKSNYRKIFVETNMEPSQIGNSIQSEVSANKAQACGV